jgi:hypothetical protein
MVGVAEAVPLAHQGATARGDGAAAPSAPVEAHLRLLLGSGGDERVWPDPETGRTRYGTLLVPAPAEVSFASSTASTIGERGYGAALHVLRRLLDQGARSRLQLQDWLGCIRAELLAFCGCSGAEVVLAASGTDAELIALAIAERVLGRPVTNIVVAPGETGSGVPKAAAGLNFLPTSCLGGPVSVGQRLAGWGSADIEVASVEIRTGDGTPRAPAAVDRDVATLAERALARGRGVLLHVLDTSKTGLGGPSREVARRVAALAPERTLVLVDACQLRCPPERLRADLDCGFLVLVTGSKFMAGPPLSGALLLPGAIADRLENAPRPPEGLADYSARLDWPERLQETFAGELATTANLGAGLRWTAALAEMQRYAAVDDDIKARFLAAFAGEARRQAAQVPGIAALDTPCPSIVPLALARPDGRHLTCAEAACLQGELRRPLPGHVRVMHVGQPVQIGPRAALRVCASAPQISRVAEGMVHGASFEEAFSPIVQDLEALFAKMGHLLDGRAA